ncbi:MAG: FAD-dependent oxidoreductase [Deltaproteobacteria bacterium]|nr:FAD-dependent oxidoreductase [Deltaproteobacteria bacterium]
MARSRLFSALRRSALLALGAQRRGVPAREHAEERRAAFAATRREFIRRSAATAGVLVVGAQLPFLAACGSEDVRSPGTASIAIVGGGMAGLMCARSLEAAGRRATIFEAQKRTGGRMWSARGRFPAEQVVELGGELIDTEHMIMRSLAGELGLTLDDFLEYDREVKAEVFYFEGRVVSEDEFLDSWASLAARIVADLGASEASSAEFERLDAMSIADWLDDVSDLDPTFRRIIEVAYTGEYGAELEQQTALNFLWLVGSDDPDDFVIFGSSDERFHTHQGNDSFPAKVAEGLKSELRLEERLVRMRKLPDGRHQLTFDRAGSATEHIFDKVVLTLPWTLLREVDFGDAISAEKARMIRELGYGTNAKLMLGFESRPWRTLHGAAGSTFCDNGPQTLWETSRGQAGAQGILTVFTGGAEGLAVGQGTPEARARAYLPALDAIYPGTQAAYRADSAVRMHWPTFDLAKGSYSCLQPGQGAWLERIGERDGNLLFAGEHTSADFQGYMEGAAESGIRAAEALLADEV